MFSPKEKKLISHHVQLLLAELNHPEMPPIEDIKFILHVDGADPVSWANIRDNKSHSVPVPQSLIRNMSV